MGILEIEILIWTFIVRHFYVLVKAVESFKKVLKLRSFLGYKIKKYRTKINYCMCRAKNGDKVFE